MYLLFCVTVISMSMFFLPLEVAYWLTLMPPLSKFVPSLKILLSSLVAIWSQLSVILANALLSSFSSKDKLQWIKLVIWPVPFLSCSINKLNFSCAVILVRNAKTMTETRQKMVIKTCRSIGRSPKLQTHSQTTESTNQHLVLVHLSYRMEKWRTHCSALLGITIYGRQINGTSLSSITVPKDASLVP